MQSTKSTIEKPLFSRIINGDIREAKSGFIASGCNSRNSNGSGLAKSLAEKWPQVKTSYHDFYAERDYLNLGEIRPVKVGENLYVVNMITQDNFGYDGGLYVSYAAIEIAFDSLVKSINRFGLEKTIHVPKIGCGLAGGDWEVVKEILGRVIPDDFELIHWEYV